MTLPERLADQIDDIRITYEDVGHGVRINGTSFCCEFDDPVDPESFCETVSTPDDPWRLFGIKHQLAEAQTDEQGNVVQSAYWKLLTTLFHVEDGEIVDASKLDLEISASWMRVYVKGGCDERRVVDFLQAVDDEYGISVELPSKGSTKEGSGID